ncbi:histidinol dehydrogenase, partial [Mesorhizobium sp.]|uniref:histidinol dehydrogenase n=1 Tax=Mesorhizobium sp. TaxID=1871066 RepID=UPI0025BA5E15
MAITLRLSDADFEQCFAAFLLTKREISADVDAVVRAIIARVRAEGDAALIEYTQKFEQADLKGLGMAVSQDDIARAYDAADPQTIEALRFARDRIRSHHERQRPCS